MSYRLVDANELQIKYPEVNDMPCIYADLDNGLDGGHYTLSAESCDCISRKEALEPYRILVDTDTLCVALIRANIMQQKSVTPEPKTGHWIEIAPEYQNVDPPYVCSECGNMHLRKTNYCDQCGADMRGE